MYGFSHLEQFYVAILYCLRLGKLGNTWNFGFGTMPCRNSVFFRVGCYLKQLTFRWPYRKEGLTFGRLLCSNSLLFDAWVSEMVIGHFGRPIEEKV